MQAMDQHGMSIRCNREETRSMLLNHGFDDVQEQAIVLPISNWAEDERGREIGRWFNLALNHSTLPMSLAPLFRVMKKTPQYIDELNKAASREVCSQAHTDGVYCMLLVSGISLYLPDFFSLCLSDKAKDGLSSFSLIPDQT